MSCLQCSNVIKGKRADAKFCSERCKTVYFLDKRAEKNGHTRVIEQKTCNFCGGIFTPSKYAYTTQIYCSKNCLTKAMNQKAVESGMKKIYSKKYDALHSEEKSAHDRWYKNVKRYSGLRDDILKRDNYKCVKCGSEKGLVIHHKDETGYTDVGDYDKINNSPENLLTLCRKCHVKLHHSVPPEYKDISKERIVEALNSTGTVREAANLLGITRKTLLLKRKEYGLPMR